jgi:hypothetical protein
MCTVAAVPLVWLQPLHHQKYVLNLILTSLDIVTDLAVLQIWTLLLNGWVLIWCFLRNDFTNTRYKFNCEEFLSSQIVGKPEQQKCNREGMCLLSQAQTLDLRGDRHWDRDRDRRDTEIKTLKRDHRTDNRRDQRTAPRHDIRGS